MDGRREREVQHQWRAGDTRRVSRPHAIRGACWVMCMALKLAQPGLGCFPWLAWVDRDHIVDLSLLLSPPGGPKVPTCPHFCDRR